MPYQRDEIHIDWAFYTSKMEKENRELYRLLHDNCHLFYDSQEKGKRTIKNLDPILSICHNDMDSKNVLRNGTDYRIIDLECLSYSSPTLELFELALCWSGYENCNIDFNLFREFIEARLPSTAAAAFLRQCRRMYNTIRFAPQNRVKEQKTFHGLLVSLYIVVRERSLIGKEISKST